MGLQFYDQGDVLIGTAYAGPKGTDGANEMRFSWHVISWHVFEYCIKHEDQECLRDDLGREWTGKEFMEFVRKRKENYYL